MLHRFIVGNYLSRGGKLFNVKQFEGVLLEKINLPRIILLHMEAARIGQPVALPHPAIVKMILKNEDISKSSLEVNCSMVLDEGLLGQMVYTKNKEGTWVSKTDLEGRMPGGETVEDD